MKFRVWPKLELYQGWNVQVRRWWGWQTLARFYSRGDAERELEMLQREHS